MQSNRWMIALALGSVLFAAACDDDETAPVLETFTASLNGANERPNPVTTPATGTATFTLNQAGTQLTYTLTVNNLSFNASAGHIHSGLATQSGGVVVPLTVNVGQKTFTTTGTITQANITSAVPGLTTFADLLRILRSDSAYVNVHSTTAGSNPPDGFPGGEIRGQLGN